MILSRRHGFLFIKGKKVGGTSIEIALDAICGPDDILTPITPRDERRRLLDHGEGARNYGAEPAAVAAWKARLRASDEGDRLPPAPPGLLRNHVGLAGILRHGIDTSGLALVVCERSPYAKIVSMAHWDLREAAYAAGGSLAVSMAEIGREVDEQVADGRCERVLNLPRYRDATGAIPSLTVLRTERLQADMSAWLATIGCADVVVPGAKRMARADEIDLGHLFTRAQLDRVNETFAEEFEMVAFPSHGIGPLPPVKQRVVTAR